MSETKLYRLAPNITEILEKVAKKMCCSESMVLERLVIKEAEKSHLIGEKHPETAFWELISMIEGWPLPADKDYTLQVFQKIESTKEALYLYNLAIEPMPGMRADKRKQSVNQRLGRFCGHKYGWETDREVEVDDMICSLIRTYTRVKPATS